MLRIKIISDNRVGITHDVLDLIAQQNINIKSMEVIPNQIHLKLEELSQNSQKMLFERLSNIPGIVSIDQVKFLPYEWRQQKINIVLNAVSEGIISIDETGLITTVNPVAAEIIQYPQEEIIGQYIGKILNNDLPILDTLKTGEGYDHLEIKLETDKGWTHYFTSGRPIIDEDGLILGAVATLTDIHNVRKLYHTIHHSSMITFEQIIYSSKVMGEIIDLAKRAASSNSTVLLKGESGTGKELFARAIHAASFRSDNPFVPINCAALPDTLLESELFGYEEGTFTGAKKGGKQGLFELADKGTIFLDEIGEIPPHIQVKLLRVLQERKVRRVGGSEEIKIDVRVIAATNKILEKMIQTQEFRDDLYYRLNVIPIEIPPLRNRRADLPYLIDFFTEELSTELHQNRKKLSADARQKLLTHHWPGNVRELRNVLERAINLSKSDTIQASDLLLHSDYQVSDSKPLKTQEEDADYIHGVHIDIKKIGQLDEMVAELEKLVLKKTYHEYHSSREAGKILGVTHTTILNKCKKYGLNLDK